MSKVANLLHFIARVSHVYLPAKKYKMFQCIHISVRFSNSTTIECFNVFITFQRFRIEN